MLFLSRTLGLLTLSSDRIGRCRFSRSFKSLDPDYTLFLVDSYLVGKDPAFWSHHANVDRVWWMRQMPDPAAHAHHDRGDVLLCLRVGRGSRPWPVGGGGGVGRARGGDNVVVLGGNNVMVFIFNVVIISSVRFANYFCKIMEKKERRQFKLNLYPFHLFEEFPPFSPLVKVFARY